MIIPPDNIDTKHKTIEFLVSSLILYNMLYRMKENKSYLLHTMNPFIRWKNQPGLQNNLQNY